MRDYESSYRYYSKYNDIKKQYSLDILSGEDAKIALVYAEMGFKDESERLFNEYKIFADNDQSIYKHLSLAVYYSYHGETGKALEHLKIFSQQDNYFYWILLFLEMDPLVDNIRDLDEFSETMSEIESKFYEYHDQVRASLEEKGLL